MLALECALARAASASPPFANVGNDDPVRKSRPSRHCRHQLAGRALRGRGGGTVQFREIARRRKLSQPVVAKVLTTLSQTGVVTGSPGPGGGYTLARAPSEISLHAIVEPFDRLDDHLVCPFGEGWCGNGPHCPLHAQLSDLRSRISAFLQDTTLAAFLPGKGS